jgi:hypothetical protein
VVERVVERLVVLDVEDDKDEDGASAAAALWRSPNGILHRTVFPLVVSSSHVVKRGQHLSPVLQRTAPVSPQTDSLSVKQPALSKLFV